MRIFVDFDDVLCETARALSAVAQRVFDKNVPYEEISVFDLRHAFSLSGDEIEHLMDIAHEIEFLEQLAPTPGAVESLRLLHAMGHEVVIVTGRPAYCHEGSVRWLRRFNLDFPEIIYLDKYGRSKPVALPGSPPVMTPDQFLSLSFDIAIDDSPAALDLLAALNECRILIYDRPWNREYQQRKSMRRVFNWSEIIALASARQR